MNVLITDNYNSYNLGDAAILEGMLAALRRELPEAAFTVTSSFPDVAEAVHGETALRWTPRTLGPVGAWWWLFRSWAWTACARRGRAARRLLDPAETRLLEATRESDVVLGVGGAYLRDGYRLTALRLWQMHVAKLLGKPVMLYAQSIGPLDPVSWHGWWARRVLSSVDTITLRDEPSRWVLDHLGVRGVPVEVTADAALSLDVPPAAPRPAGTGRRIGVSVLHWHKFARGSYEAYRAAVAAALDGLVAEMDASVTFLSTTVAPEGAVMNVSGTTRDDLAAARDVVAAMRRADRAVVETEAQPLAELRARIASFDLWVGTRMHSCIFATTAGVPAVGIGYEPKVAGYFALLGLPELVVDIETITAEALADRAREAWRRREEIRARLAQRVPELRMRADRNAQIAAALARAAGTPGHERDRARATR